VKEWSKISENSQSEKNPWFAEIYLNQEIKSKVEKLCEVIRNHKPTESIDLKEISKNIQKAKDTISCSKKTSLPYNKKIKQMIFE
jgi:hypothetical protein